jgi:hypothetical protein
VSGLVSPDVPAFWCYAVILVIGAVASYATVNQLLRGLPGPWAFVSTWLLFLAHAALPLALFFLLDYTSALNDTSLFAALVVAFAYQQIFAGGVQGLTMPGQTAALWKPFQSWVNYVADRITTRHKRNRDRFDDNVRSLILGDSSLRNRFTTLVLASSADPAALQTARSTRTKTGDTAADERLDLNLLWRDLRASQTDYGWLLHSRGIVGKWRYWVWLNNGVSQLVLILVLILAIAVVFCLYLWFSTGPEGGNRWHNVVRQYYEWRFTKPNATDRDQWRSEQYLSAELRSLGSKPIETVELAVDRAHRASLRAEKARKALERLPRTSPDRTAEEAAVLHIENEARAAVETSRRSEAAQALVGSLVKELQFARASAAHTSRVLKVLLNTHSYALNTVSIPRLIASLREANDITRLQIRKTLVGLQEADYPKPILKEQLRKWEPKPDETPADIDRVVREWQDWWRAAQVNYPPPPGP